MEYGALAVGMADELLSHLQIQFAPQDLRFEAVPTVQAANRQLSEKAFHLLIADLEYLRSIGQTTWLEGIRQITFAPLIVLSDTPEQDSGGMVELGADICVSGKKSLSMVVDVVFAQFRRYTEYNHCDDPRAVAAVAFRLGDISIDQPRHIVIVRGREVNLRPREFDLLLMFMRNPDKVMSPEEICKRAWNMDTGYDQGVSRPIRLLRQAVEGCAMSVLLFMRLLCQKNPRSYLPPPQLRCRKKSKTMAKRRMPNRSTRRFPLAWHKQTF